MSDFLDSIGLSKYIPKKMTALGWDDLGFLRTLSPEDLRAVGEDVGMLPGHLAKFVAKFDATSPAYLLSPNLPPDLCSPASTFIAVAVDCSGSMQSVGAEVMNGFNTFLEEQKKNPGPCCMTVARFDDAVEVMHNNMPIASVPKASAHTFRPRGMTALLDAIGTVTTLAASQEKNFEKIIVLVLTDGDEHASKNYTLQMVKDMIAANSKKAKWDFVFMGANQDAVLSGTSMGFGKDNCLTYAADPEHTRATFRAASDNCTRGRAGMPMAFSQMDRQRTTDF